MARPGPAIIAAVVTVISRPLITANIGTGTRSDTSKRAAADRRTSLAASRVCYTAGGGGQTSSGVRRPASGRGRTSPRSR